MKRQQPVHKLYRSACSECSDPNSSDFSKEISHNELVWVNDVFRLFGYDLEDILPDAELLDCTCLVYPSGWEPNWILLKSRDNFHMFDLAVDVESSGSLKLHTFVAPAGMTEILRNMRPPDLDAKLEVSRFPSLKDALSGVLKVVSSFDEA